MSCFLCLVLCCVVGVQVTWAQGPYYSPNLLKAYERSNGMGPIEVHPAVGVLPTKYVPLTYSDTIATAKAAAIFPHLLRIFPEIDLVDTVEPIKMDYPDLWLRGKLYLSNLKVEGIHQIQLENLEIRTINNRVDFAARTPRLTGKADFKSESFIGMLPVFLSGSLSIDANDVSIVGAVSTKKASVPLYGEVYQVDGADVTVHINDINVRLNQANGSEVPNLDIITKHVIDQIKDELANIILVDVLKEVNNELAKVPAMTVDAYLHNTDQEHVLF